MFLELAAELVDRPLIGTGGEFRFPGPCRWKRREQARPEWH